MIFQKPTNDMRTEVWVTLGEDTTTFVGIVDQMHDCYSMEIRRLEAIAKNLINDHNVTSKVANLNLANAQLDKKEKLIKFSWEGSWPTTINITSHITGTIVKYKMASYDHPKFDFGLGMIYVPVDSAETEWVVMLREI